MSAPVVIPYALTTLAQGLVLDAALTTAQTVFTVQNGMKCYPMFIVFRDASATVHAAATFNLGNTSSATAYLSASTLLQSMLTTTGAVFQPLYGSSIATARQELNQSDVLSVTFGGTLTSNGIVKVDVLGYLFIA